MLASFPPQESRRLGDEASAMLQEEAVQCVYTHLLHLEVLFLKVVDTA